MQDDAEGQFLSRSRTESLLGECAQNWCYSEVSDLIMSYMLHDKPLNYSNAAFLVGSTQAAG